MDESVIRSVAVFFYLNLFDAKQAFSVSQRTLAAWKNFGSQDRSDLIPLAKRMLRHARSMSFFLTSSVPGEFALPPELRIDAWMEFKKRAEPSEFETVLWSQVLGFSTSEVAKGLQVSEGTVRYRLNHGLRLLGRFL